MTRIRRACGVLLLAALLAVAGCDKLMPGTKTPFHAIDVTGTSLGGELRLTDHHGRPRTLADFRGKVVVLTFGFTHCPDVCPTTLADFASALKRLGPESERVQVLFITVDPKRDTAELLRQYVPAFHPSFLGLRGDESATAKVTKDFGIYANARAGKTPDTYTVDHSAQSMVLDAQGRPRLVIGHGLAPEKIASDLRLLLNG